jgi:hypothetical protein
MIGGFMKRKLVTAAAALFFSLSFLVPVLDASPKKNYYLCVGSFRSLEKTKDCYNWLTRDGVAVMVSRNMVRGRPFYHVLLNRKFSGYGQAMKTIGFMRSFSRYFPLHMNDVWVFDKPVILYSLYDLPIDIVLDPDEYLYSPGSNEYPVSVICRRGSGEKEPVAGPADPFRIVQVVPDNVSVSESIPLIVLFSDTVLLPSVAGNFLVTADGVQIDGFLRLLLYENNRTAICFTPKSGIWPKSGVHIEIRDGLSSVRGVKLAQGYSGNMGIKNLSPAFLSDSGFEGGKTPDGAVFDGDGAVLEKIPGVFDSGSGDGYAAVTNGRAVASVAPSVSDRNSFLSVRLPSISGFKCKYNFVSSEFNEFSTLHGGDISFAVVWGKGIQKIDVLASVEKNGYNNTQLPYKRFLSLPDVGDVYAGQTGWKEFDKEMWKSKESVFAVFIISNVRDLRYTSVLTVDDIGSGK